MLSSQCHGHSQSLLLCVHCPTVWTRHGPTKEGHDSAWSRSPEVLAEGPDRRGAAWETAHVRVRTTTSCKLADSTRPSLMPRWGTQDRPQERGSGAWTDAGSSPRGSGNVSLSPTRPSACEDTNTVHRMQRTRRSDKWYSECPEHNPHGLGTQRPMKISAHNGRHSGAKEEKTDVEIM